MKRYLRLAGMVALICTVFGGGLFAWDWKEANMPNTTRNLAVRFGASEGEIARVASAYGIAMESIREYGDSPFPTGIIAAQLGFNRAETERGIVRRRDAEAFVKGYLAVCRPGRYLTLYLFYSRRFEPKPWRTGESALVVTFHYQVTPQTVNQDPADDILNRISYADLNSDSDWLGSPSVQANMALTCVPPVTTR